MAFSVKVMGDSKSPRKSPSCASCNFRNETVVYRSEKITKSPTDKKTYRYIHLANGLKATLVCDRSGDSRSSQVNYSSSQMDDKNDSDVSLNWDPRHLCGKCLDHLEHSGGVTTSAAAMCVKTGYYDDPPDFPGLAHLLEHMVFMGSEKFPDVNDFDSFCARYGASLEPNARTDCETLVFFFDIESRFKQALYRFAQFFISPLLKKDCIEKEINAIDHEFKIAMSNDIPRKHRLLASLAEKGHPAGNFVWGNRQVLKIEPERRGKNLHAVLKAFQKRAFVANQMTLAVYSSSVSLDDMEMWVARFFSSIPFSKLEPACVEDAEVEKKPPFMPERFAKIFKVVPVMSIRELELTWCLPSQVKNYRSKPLAYLSWIIGNECQGSLISYLRKKFWATSLWCQNGQHGVDHNSFWSAFNISITLTADGQEKVDEILLSVFSYLALMREAGPQRRIFEEMRTIYNTAFLWEHEMHGNELCESLAQNMLHYDMEDVLTGPILLSEYRPEQITKCLNQLVPDTVNVCIYSKDFEDLCDLSEKWFQTKYCVQEMDKLLLKKLEGVTPSPEFKLPEMNEFIATDFSLVETIRDKSKNHRESPRVVMQTEKCKMWHKGANRFDSSKVYLSFHLISPQVCTSAQSGVLFDLFIHLVEQNLMESTYLANLADLWHRFDQEKSGMTVQLHGFRDKFEKFFNIVVDCLENFHVETADFIVGLEEMGNLYHNLMINPQLYARELLKSTLHQVHHTAKDKAPYLKNLDIDLFMSFINEFKQSVFIEGYASGNILEKEAVAYMTTFVERIQPKEGLKMSSRHLNFLMEPQVYPCSKLPEVRMVELPLGDRVFKTRSLKSGDTSACIINYYQIGQASIKNECMAGLLMSLMTEPCFAYLRTKEQLGYEAVCFEENWHGIIGISISVDTDSAKFSMEEVDYKIETFLSWFAGKLSTMPAEEFEDKLQTELTQRETEAGTMEEEARQDWEEIFSQEYMFDRPEKEAEILGCVQIKEFLAWYRLYMATSLRRKLSIQICGSLKRSRSLEREDEVQAVHKKHCSLLQNSSGRYRQSIITTIEEFKQELFVYPVKRRKPYM